MLPFADGTFDGALSFNVVDCAASPLGPSAGVGPSPASWSISIGVVTVRLECERDAGGPVSRWPLAAFAAARIQRRRAPPRAGRQRERIGHQTGTGACPTAGVCQRARASMDYAVDPLHLERSAAAG